MLIFDRRNFSLSVEGGEKPKLILTNKRPGKRIDFFDSFFPKGPLCQIRWSQNNFQLYENIIYIPSCEPGKPFDKEVNEIEITEAQYKQLTSPTFDDSLLNLTWNYVIFKSPKSAPLCRTECKESALYRCDRSAKEIAFWCKASVEEFHKKSLFPDAPIRKAGNYLILDLSFSKSKDIVGWILLHARLLNNPREYNLSTKQKEAFYSWNKEKKQMTYRLNWVHKLKYSFYK